MTIHKCDLCDYETKQSCNYSRHIKSAKHLKIVEKTKKVIQKDDNYINLSENISLDTILKLVNDKFNKMENKIENKMEDRLDRIENKMENMEHKIIKEQRKTNRNIMTILMQDYSNNPSLTQINQVEFMEELEKHYKTKINTEDCKLQTKMVNDFNNKKLIDVILKLILKFIKNNNLTLQSVFNTDSTRSNYATKLNKSWYNDKLGLQLKNIILIPVIQYLLTALEYLNTKLVVETNANYKCSSIARIEFIVKYTEGFLKTKNFLNDKKTHDEIIFKLAPHLRFDKEYLEISN